MRRRQFITGLGSTAVWPVVAQAQQAAVPVIGFLLAQSADDYKNAIVAFLQGQKETGYVRGRTRPKTESSTAHPLPFGIT
jgi:hypothetical protein